MLPRRRGSLTLVTLALMFGAFVWLGRVIPRHDAEPAESVRAPAPAPELLFTVLPETTPVRWRPWNAATFERAQRENKPIVALVDAAWSESAQLYAATLAASEQTRAALENDVVAVRVDIDRRPDVHARFHVTFDTLPTLVFMTAHGRVWDVRDALGPKALQEAIVELRRSSVALADSEIDLLAAARPNPAARATPPRGERVGEILAALSEAWPHPEEILEHDTPILSWDAFGFLRAHVEATNASESRALFLRGLRQLLASPLLYDATFWRDAEGAEDRVSRARTLETNALLLDHFETAARWTHDEVYFEAASGIRTFLIETLWDEDQGLFRAAQGTLIVNENGWPLLTGEEFTDMRGHEHGPELAPHVVPLFPSAANARASAALLHANRDVERARRALGTLWAAFEQRGYLPHDFAVQDSELRASPVDFAADYAQVGLAFLEAAILAPDATSGAEWLGRARALAESMLQEFADARSGLFRDARAPSAVAPERMQVKLTPLVDNARAARFLIALTVHTGDPQYAAVADQTLGAWNASLWNRSVWEACEFGIAILR